MTATYTENELREFDRITSDLSSLDQLARISARMAINRFIETHGREKCDAMFAVLQRKDKQRRRG